MRGCDSARIEAVEPRILLSIAEPQPIARPAYNTASGFFVEAGAIYDANGYPFLIRGFNHSTWWGNATEALAAIGEFPKTRANAIRAVFGPGFGPSQTPSQRK